MAAGTPSGIQPRRVFDVFCAKPDLILRNESGTLCHYTSACLVNYSTTASESVHPLRDNSTQSNNTPNLDTAMMVWSTSRIHAQPRPAVNGTNFPSTNIVQSGEEQV